MSVFAKTPPGRPDLRQRLHIELAEMAHNSRIVVKPGPDDWFDETEISQFITNVEVEAKVGDVTKAHFDCLKVEVVTERGSHLAGVITPQRFWRLRRLWFRLRVRKVRRIQLKRGTA